MPHLPSALLQGGLDSTQDLVVGVTKNGWAPGQDVVDVLVAIHVPDVGALDVVKHDGVAWCSTEYVYTPVC